MSRHYKRITVRVVLLENLNRLLKAIIRISEFAALMYILNS